MLLALEDVSHWLKEATNVGSGEMISGEALGS
jgi:hypothetical protein